MSRGVRIRGRQRESGGPVPTVLRTPQEAGSMAAHAVILWPVTGAQTFKVCLWGDDYGYSCNTQKDGFFPALLRFDV